MTEEPHAEAHAEAIVEEAKDEVVRVADRLRLRNRREQVLVGAVAVFAVVSSWAILSNRQLAERLHQSQVTGHASRLADQARTDGEIRALACFLVAGVPDSRDPRVAGFRAAYGCPAYTGPGVAPGPTPTRTITLPGATATTTETVPAPFPVPGPTQTRTRVVTRTRTVPAPRPTICLNGGRVCITLPVK